MENREVLYIFSIARQAFVYVFCSIGPKPITYRRRDSTVELSRVGGVNAPVGSRDPVYNFLCCWAIEVGDKWRHNEVIVEKVTNIDQNSRSQPATESVWSLYKLSTEFVGSRREL